MGFVGDIVKNMKDFFINPWGLGLVGYLLLVVLITIGLIIYFLPTIIADKRKNKQFLTIRLLNIFAGWTFLVWLGCLVWASLREDTDRIK